MRRVREFIYSIVLRLVRRLSLELQEFAFIPLLEVLYENRVGDRFHAESVLVLVVDGMRQPLLRRMVLELLEELKHLLRCPLRNLILILHILPELQLCHFFLLMNIDHREQSDTLKNCKLFLGTNVESLELFTKSGVVNDHEVLLDLESVRPTGHHPVICHGMLDDRLPEPLFLEHFSKVEVPLLQFGIIVHYLVGVALELVDDHSSVALDELDAPVSLPSEVLNDLRVSDQALWDEEHYRTKITVRIMNLLTHWNFSDHGQVLDQSLGDGPRAVIVDQFYLQVLPNVRLGHSLHPKFLITSLFPLAFEQGFALEQLLLAGQELAPEA